MGFVSYSEDILKRHEADVHDLMRALEAGQISEARQNHAIPEFQVLVKKLGELLSDPAQPVAMRLLEIRNRATNLEFERDQLRHKNEKLGATNSQLNEKIRFHNRDIKSSADLARRESVRCEELQERIAVLERNLSDTQEAVSARDKKIGELEALLMQAQVDVRYSR